MGRSRSANGAALSSRAAHSDAALELNGWRGRLPLSASTHIEPELRPILSVIVPASRDAPTLERCLAAIDAARGAHDEVIVVEDQVRLGPASARNRGAATASNEILVFVDADVEVGEDAFDLIRARFAADRGLAAVFGSYDENPEEQDVVSTFRNLLHHYVHHDAAGNVGSFWAGLGAVRRTAFDEVGGFDVRIARASVEDIELGARLGVAGTICLDPTIRGKHLKRWTVFSMVRTDLTLRGIPWTRLALRGRATRNELNLSWRHRASAASSLGILLSLMGRRPRAAGVAFGALWVLNQRFYRLLAHRGPRYLICGVCLHIIHDLTSITSLALGLCDAALVHGRDGRRGLSQSELVADVLDNVPSPEELVVPVLEEFRSPDGVHD